MTSGRRDKDPHSTSSKRENEREKAEKERAAAAAATERLKTVVRRLPPNLPEDVFWQSVQQWVTDETATWKVFYPGKLKKRINKENVPSRAYIAFKNVELLTQFSRDYDGHVFRDKQGNESHAIVEFAPYQKIPSEKRKFDARNATIEKDEDYISFVASLKEPANTEPVSVEALVAANQAPPMPKTTPLLEALKAEKSASKDKEAILRNHAHYKDPAILASTNALRGAHAVVGASSKDEAGKKKGGPSTQPKEAAFADAGKKGKKAHVTQAAVAKQQHAPAAAKKEHAPSPKPSRAARQQAAAARAAAAAQTAAQPQVRVSDNRPAEAPPVSASSSGEGGGAAATAPASVAANVGAAVAASRRGRPIVGLGSRHLQAALSQVGAAAIERKRREREKDISAKEGTSANAVDASVETGQGLELGIDGAIPTSPEPHAGREISKPGSPSSPRRDRRRKDRVGHQPEGGLKVPSIMQRPDGVPPPALQRDAPGQVLPSPARPQITSTHNMGDNSNGHTGGHPPRGPRRGRGRGRGGPVHRGG